jgi:N-acetylated-alpha-linked acidic dipeptidase
MLLLLCAILAAGNAEQALLETPDPARLRAYHEMLGSEPHVAGTPGDQRVIEQLAETFAEMGLEVERHEFHAYLPRPLEAEVEIVSPVQMTLSLQEDALPEDPDTSHPELGVGWNAYSGNGDVTAEVVYANYGTKRDFEKLAELGVEVAGRIVIARYGGNYRGYKARFAQAAGAAGLIIYTDPDDSGYRRGITYPEGGWAHESHIQRGSIVTLPYSGDPLTPFVPADATAERLDAAAVDLPRIPVQPLSWRAASEILERMTGRAVPSGWQGGLPFAYRVTGGPDLHVRLMVRQDRRLRSSGNVVATIRGARDPEQLVVVGCHHDAWGFGASDPLAGLIVLMECARSFSELARQGIRPRRSVVFAAWGAEEFGITYLNLDMAAMGPRFGASASPSLKPLLFAATRLVDQVRDESGASVYDAWLGRAGPDADEPTVGNLGGGSDHVGFLCHLGVPAFSIGGGGSPGSAYHSNHDTVAWYRQVVGDDYEPARMLTQVANIVAWRLADDAVLPLDPLRYATDARVHLNALRDRAAQLDMDVDFSDLETSIGTLEEVAGPALVQLPALAAGPFADRVAINERLIAAERSWLVPEGLPERPWFRNLFAATDPNSGYAAWMLPGLRYAIEKQDAAELERAILRYRVVFGTMAEHFRPLLEEGLGPG